MNRSILIVIILGMTVATYLLLYFVIGMEEKKALFVTGFATLAMIIPEVIGYFRRRR